MRANIFLFIIISYHQCFFLLLPWQLWTTVIKVLLPSTDIKPKPFQNYNSEVAPDTKHRSIDFGNFTIHIFRVYLNSL